MTTSDDTSPAGGTGGPGGTDEKPTTVTRDAYDRLLSEKKAAAERARLADEELQKLRQAEKDREEAELRKKSEFETLLKTRDEELKSERAKLAALESERLEARKFGAFLRSVGEPIDPKFHALIDLDKIKLNSDGTVDESSLTKYAGEFKQQYPETYGKPPTTGVPSEKPKGTGSPLTYEQWLALPHKERKARMGEVANQIK